MSLDLLQTLSFASPWMLAGLLLLPALWWLLRVLPPAPRRLAFPALRLLMGLQTDQKTPNSAPWWLVLLRLAAAAAVILALAHPLLNPTKTLPGSGPLILVVDDDWSSAGGWDARMDYLIGLTEEADRADKSVFLVTTTSEDGTPPQDRGVLRPNQAKAVLQSLKPKSWEGDRMAALRVAEGWRFDGSANVFWASNGLGGEDYSGFAEGLQRLGSLTVLEPDATDGPVAVSAPEKGGADLRFKVKRSYGEAQERIALIARAIDGRALAREEVTFGADALEAEAVFTLPAALRNELARVETELPRGAAAVSLIDERWRDRPVGLIDESALDTVPALLSEAYYVRRALEPLGQLSFGPLNILMKGEQAVIVAPDSTKLTDQDREMLSGWIEEGGVLVRFAGPRLAQDIDDGLTPVRLRRGGRVLGGAMLWTEPLKLGPFSQTSPFADLAPPQDVVVMRQVLAEPSLDLDTKTWARLQDGTPLITAAQRGQGWVVLVHTTANADWSTLALSGTFVEILERLIDLSNGITSNVETADTLLPPDRILDGFGRLVDPGATVTPLSGEDLSATPPNAKNPPGFYGTDDLRRAYNLAEKVWEFSAPDVYPAGVAPKRYQAAATVDLKPFLLTAAMVLVLIDGLVTLFLRGFVNPMQRRQAGGVAALLVLGLFVAAPDPAAAQNEDIATIEALDGTVLAYVRTGDAEVDRASQAGLYGLALVLNRRTAVEASNPVGVDIDNDELAFYPLLYWPITANQQPLNAATVDRLNEFMASGGTILFDTRDQATGGVGGDQTRILQRVARGLDIPTMEQVGPEHVLTKSFYLMQDFPGRWTGSPVWVQAGGETSNDSVSRVIVGGNDWAAAWAVDELGQPLYAVVPGGDRQREMAYRFGVNLVMYTLTGNYKADQVHVPAILERLGQ
ncbi:DUF4159 domain-containing protein [Hwanghaeella sp.]|uniref:DUF4159 domain-containing protein n=1 Tax=Hwanghaeella sp. TaxID=2605943 RepID=UPI003CCC2BB6